MYFIFNLSVEEIYLNSFDFTDQRVEQDLDLTCLSDLYTEHDSKPVFFLLLDGSAED